MGVEIISQVTNVEPSRFLPQVSDALLNLFGNYDLLEAYEAKNISQFENLCPTSVMPRMLWAEANNIVKDLSAYLAKDKAILPLYEH
jgi:hypothetical protein